MRISDWSSDVCSSDLRDGRLRLGQGIAKTHTIDGEEQLAFADHLIVPDMHLLNPAGHIGRQRHYVGAYLSVRSEEHTSELQSLMRISYAVFCLKKKIQPSILAHSTVSRHNESRYRTMVSQTS